MDGSGTADQVDRVAVSPDVSIAGATHTHEVDPLAVTQRLQREGRWKDIEPQRDEMMKLARKQGMSKSEAQAWVYSELDRMYPPLPKEDKADNVRRKMQQSDDPKADNVRPQASKISSYGQIQGLNEIPEDWPDSMPSNTSISSEIGWVQANRLRIVSEKPSGATLVRLSQAMSPAPSWAAIGWLETSIRSYAKFVDVAAKVSGAADDEGAVMRRERIAIAEVERLLDEMREEQG